MENTNKFDESELQGRNKFNTFCNRQPWCKVEKFNDDKYGSWDVAYYSGDTKILGEIKDRNYSSEDFGGWYMEVDKLTRLQNISSKRSDLNVTYINTYINEDIIIWDVTDIKPTNTFLKELDRTTVEDNGTRIKEVFTLYKCDSIVWSHINEETMLERLKRLMDSL